MRSRGLHEENHNGNLHHLTRRDPGEAISGIAFAYASLYLSGFTLRPVQSCVHLAACVAAVCILASSVSLMYGMNEIAAGSTAVVATALSMLVMSIGPTDVATVLARLAGAATVFLPNSPPSARTLMGDYGSLSVGCVVAASVVEVLSRVLLTAPMILGLIIVMPVPLADTTLAVLCSLRRGGNVLQGGRRHLCSCMCRGMGDDRPGAAMASWGICKLNCTMVGNRLGTNQCHGCTYCHIHFAGPFIAAVMIGMA